jgi:UDP-N-acetylglucosamine 1-carboxyvinyltransferase
LRQLGVEVDIEHFRFNVPGRLTGRTMFFDEASVTATEHILMVAVMAKGTTTLLNAASEPHVQDLVKLLIAMGASIEGAGSNTLVIEGVERLGGATHRVVSDHIEAGSYLALAAATGGAVTIHGTSPSHYWMTHRIFERFGVEFANAPGKLVLGGGQRPRVRTDAGGAFTRIADGPWPQFPSDLMSAMLVLATQAEGTVMFFEKMFESRMYFVDPLIQMGANIVVCDPHRVLITGRTALRGQTMRSPDIRAGMALIMAALCAEGRCIVQNAEIVDRGYEDIDNKLRALGADIVRESVQ